MICPKCESNLNIKKKKCDRCGANVEMNAKIIRLSNTYYNRGLERAKVRDLSGAITALKNSLKLDKTNYMARNLLGLIYFETGEVVKALSEWVISKHFRPENNSAEYYLNEIQNNPTKLESLNSTIKKYNQALASAQVGNDDIAIIQLKKIILNNPNYIAAMQLLAILYMKNNESNKAKRYLLKAKQIDVSNVKTLIYLSEIEAAEKKNSVNRVRGKDSISAEDKDIEFSIVPISSYKEDKPNIMAFINLIIGVGIGIATVYLLVVPAVKRNFELKFNSKYAEYNAVIAKQQDQEDTIKALRNDKEELQNKIDQLSKQIEETVIPDINKNLKEYDTLLEIVDSYMKASKANNKTEMIAVAESLLLINEELIETNQAKLLLTTLKDATYPEASTKFYRDGYNLYSANKFEEAQKELEKAYKFDENNLDAIYFLGRAYHQLNDLENARVYYEILINDHENTRRASQAKQQLNSLQ